MQKVIIHTDGSCLGNPGPGGWAAVIKDESGHYKFEISGGYALTTNNRMEILAVVEALQFLKEPSEAEVWSDSRYVCDSVEKGWIQSWQNKGWVKSDRKPVLNMDLWQRLLPLLATHKVKMRWLKGHAGHPENERCDTLARTQASRLILPEDEGYNA
ncbi:MAG: ribonuclease HI [Desulfovibrio desulfuricans]|nr:ribonuclease HI [Desulfovibrio desulfuricans]